MFVLAPEREREIGTILAATYVDLFGFIQLNPQSKEDHMGLDETESISIKKLLGVSRKSRHSFLHSYS